MSPAYMKEAWRRELEVIAEDGLTPEEMLVLALEEGSEDMPFFGGCSVYPIFPGAASKYVCGCDVPCMCFSPALLSPALLTPALPYCTLYASALPCSAQPCVLLPCPALLFSALCASALPCTCPPFPTKGPASARGNSVMATQATCLYTNCVLVAPVIALTFHSQLKSFLQQPSECCHTAWSRALIV